MCSFGNILVNFKCGNTDELLKSEPLQQRKLQPCKSMSSYYDDSLLVFPEILTETESIILEIYKSYFLLSEFEGYVSTGAKLR